MPPELLAAGLVTGVVIGGWLLIVAAIRLSWTLNRYGVGQQ